MRLVGIAITLVAITVVSTLGYSVYADVHGVISALGGKGLAATRTVSSGESATFVINITIPNAGLYPVSLSISCSPPPGSQFSCSPADVTIPPGQTGVLVFSVTDNNITAATSPGASFPANATVSLDPFASISIGFNLGSLLSQGGVG